MKTIYTDDEAHRREEEEDLFRHKFEEIESEVSSFIYYFIYFLFYFILIIYYFLIF